MSFIRLSNVTKTYFATNEELEKVQVLDCINLEVDQGDFVALFGPNGSGKTTLLNCISGLTPTDNGEIFINNRPPKEARIGYIFQNYRETLLPWDNAIDNVAFPLELQGVKKSIRRKKAKAFLEKLGIEIPESNYPYQLSGGQQQLAVIARALLFKPDVLLLDEPFSALDYQTRFYMQRRLLDIWKRTKTTIVFVSHELEEAIFLAQHLVLLSKRPASIIETLTIPFEYPRNHNILESHDFFQIKTKALRVFKEQLI